MEKTSSQASLRPLGPVRLFFKAPGERRRPPREADVVVHLFEPDAPGLPIFHNFREFWPLRDELAGSVKSFLCFSLGVWAADKLVCRASWPDAWTREIVLEFPSSSDLLKAGQRLAHLAGFLTGDKWDLRPREAPLPLNFGASWPQFGKPTAVVLFSGGLDSLVGAIDLLEEGHRLVLVSHYDYGQLAATQQTLAAALAQNYGRDRLYHLQIRVQLEGPELSLRSRSLLYLALALTAAGAFPTTLPVTVPENGWISLNPPLTLNRLGSYSTRTTHPYFIRELAGLWQDLGLGFGVANPGQDLTKGEMLARCRNLRLLRELFPLSVSCARPVVGRWRRQPAGACGYCYPCLMRRVALHRMGWDRGEHYRVDVLGQASALRHRVQGQDLRSLCLALKTWQESPGAILARLWWGEYKPGETEGFSAPWRLLTTGFQEIANWLYGGGEAAIRNFLGNDGLDALPASYPSD
jgi:7-cyano-7-deazaguanine synthase in queuosine biosynthesis